MKGLAWNITTDTLSCPEACMALFRTANAYHLGSFLVVQDCFLFCFIFSPNRSFKGVSVS